MYSAPATPRTTAGETSRPALTVTVLFTDVPHTLTAVRQAASLGSSLNASLRILMPVIVPYPLALSEPPVDCRILHGRLRTVAEGADIPTRIDVVYCRDRAEAAEKCLEPHSVVVVCWRKRWLFDSNAGLVKRLSRRGHHVITARRAKGD
jgi:hypothetical protein